MQNINDAYNRFCSLVTFHNAPVNHQVDLKTLKNLMASTYNHNKKMTEIFNELHDYIKIYYELNVTDIKDANRFLTDLDMWDYFLHIGKENFYGAQDQYRVKAPGLSPISYKIVCNYLNSHKVTEFSLLASDTLKAKKQEK